MKNKRKPPALVNLSRKEVRRALKPHTGFERYLELLLRFYEELSAEIGSIGIDVDELRDSMQAYKDLAQDEMDALVHYRRVRQTRLKHGSTVWRGMLDIYALGGAASRRNFLIARRLSPFRRFMKHAPRKKPAAPK